MRRGNHGPEVTVKDEQCSRLGLSKPRSQRPCRRVACDYIWQEGPWSEVPSYLAIMIYDLSISCYIIRLPILHISMQFPLDCFGCIPCFDRAYRYCTILIKTPFYYFFFFLLIKVIHKLDFACSIWDSFAEEFTGKSFDCVVGGINIF